MRFKKYFYLGIVAIIPACSSSHITTVLEGQGARVERGTVYHLPKTVYSLSLVKEEDKAMTLSLNGESVADRSMRFTLNSNINEIFDRNHSVTIKNGLLNAVTVVDDGRLDDVVVTAVKSILTPGSLSSITAKSRGPASVVSSEPATPEEVAEILEMIPVGTQTFIFERKNNQAYEIISGTRNLLRVNIFSDDLSDIQNKPSARKIKNDLEKVKCCPDRKIGGLLTRTATKIPVKVSFKIDARELTKWRETKKGKNPVFNASDKATLARYNQMLGVHENEIARHEKLTLRYEGELAVLQKAYDAISIDGDEKAMKKRAEIQSRIVILKKSLDSSANVKLNQIVQLEKLERTIAQLNTKKSNSGTVTGAHPGGKDTFFSTGNYYVSTIDESLVSFIPLERSLIGETRYTLSMTDGVLHKFASIRPNQAVAFAKLPLDVATAIVSVPVPLFKSLTLVNTAESEYTKSKVAELGQQVSLLTAEDKLNNIDSSLKQSVEITQLNNQISLIEAKEKLRALEEKLDKAEKEREASN